MQDLLAAGVSVGSQFALGKLFGSQPATEAAKQAETVAVGKNNGSGPVNAQASMQSPKSWTDLLFGTKAASAQVPGAPTDKPVGLSTFAKVLLVAVAVGLGWFLLKKA